jgi:4-aminobutyrate aminotransferase
MTGLREIQKKHPGLVKDVRGIGLMIGVEFDSHEHAAAVEWASFQRGVLALEAGMTVVRISPPLVITEAEAATGLRLFGEAVAEVAAKG